MAVALIVLVGGAARAEGVNLFVRNASGTYEVRGRFETTAPRDTVWAVLTDYGRIPSFVQSMKQSEVLARESTRVRIRQVATIGMYPVRRTAHVTLEVQERPKTRIEFRDVLGGDFHAYEGAWSLSGDSTRTVVEYALDAAPRAGAPRWLGRGMLSHSVRDLLTQVRAEVARRAGVR